MFLAEVSAVAKGLIAAGLEPGDRVALFSKTRYEWTLLDYAIWFAGAVTVPIYETSSAEQVRWILADSGAKAVVAEGPEHVARIAEIRAELTELNQVWSFADNGPAQGLHPHARELHVRARRGRARAGPALPGRGAQHTALPAAGARVR